MACAPRSAGSTPAKEINPVVMAGMAEIGLDLSAAFPKPLTEGAVRTADVVITMGCETAVPSTPANAGYRESAGSRGEGSAIALSASQGSTVR